MINVERLLVQRDPLRSGRKWGPTRKCDVQSQRLRLHFWHQNWKHWEKQARSDQSVSMGAVPECVFTAPFAVNSESFLQVKEAVISLYA